MSVNINASTTNGLVLTSDTSGELKLQANGADIATVNSSGITMASGKTLPASALTGSLPAGIGGKVLQVVQSSTTTQTAVTSTTYTDSSITGTITPSSTSSKIFVIVSISGRMFTTTTSDRDYYANLVRNSTQISEKIWKLQGTAGGGGFYTVGMMESIVELDSPSTTSATTYKVQLKVSNTANSTYIEAQSISAKSTITLMEIAG